MFNFKIPPAVSAWLTSESSIYGFAVAGAGAVVAALHGAPMVWAPMVAGGAVSIALKQNSPNAALVAQLSRSLESVAIAGATGGLAGAVRQALTDLPGDVVAVQGAFQTSSSDGTTTTLSATVAQTLTADAPALAAAEPAAAALVTDLAKAVSKGAAGVVLIGLVGGALSACTPAQEAQFQAACHIASVSEALDPALAEHNGKVVAGQTVLCAGDDTHAAQP